MLRRPMDTTPGIGIFALFVFMLLTVPRLNIKIGPAPLYFIDLLIICLLLLALNKPPMPGGKRKFSGLISAILMFVIVSEIFGVLRFGTLVDSVYITGRTLLAFSVFIIAGQFVRTVRDFEFILRAAVLGVIVTATLMILMSLPMTRVQVTDLVFSNRFLEPAASSVTEKYTRLEDGARGRTLVGVSILGATFINAAWPLAALMLRWPWPTGIWRAIAATACLIAPMGVLMSYSRGPIVGTVLILLAVIFLGLRRLSPGIIRPIAFGIGLIMIVGVGSQIFFFDRVVNRFAATIEDPTGEGSYERTLGYVEPFWHVIEHPRFLFLGEGNTVRYTEVDIRPEQVGKATHSLFAISYYSYGMIAAFLYMILLFRALSYATALAVKRRGTPVGFFAQPLVLSMVALLPWAAFGHAAVSAPRGAMLLFLILGLISALAHFKVPAQKRTSTRRHGNVDSRRPAFG